MYEGTNKLVWDYFASIAAHHLPTGLHSIRVGKTAQCIGDALGLDGVIIHEMGLVHDIGKKAVPINILSLDMRPPSKEEFEIIKTHTRVGYDLLKDVLPLHACIAGKHHPTYAVAEYPLLLSIGDRVFVDVCVPIVTLCDFYDALMTRHNTAYTSTNRRSVASIRELLEKNFPKQKEQIDILLGSTIGPYVRKKRIA